MSAKTDALARKLGPRLAKWLYGAYTAPATTAAVGASGGAAAAAPAAGGYGVGSGSAAVAPAAGATNISGGALASEGLAGVGWGGALAMLAPAFMAWQAYTRGSGQNDPLRKRNEVAGIAKYLTDLFRGKDADDEGYGLFQNYIYTTPGETSDGHLQGERPSRKLTPYESIRQLIPLLRYGGGREINANITPQQFYGHLRNQGVTDDWLAETTGRSDWGDWGNENFDMATWLARADPNSGGAYGMRDLTMEGLRDAALGGDKDAEKAWYEANPYQTPEEAKDPEWNSRVVDMTGQGYDLIAMRQANPFWNVKEEDMTDEQRQQRDALLYRGQMMG